MSEDEFQKMFLAHAPEPVKKYWGRKRPVEIRPVSLVHYVSKEKLKPEQHIWVRTTGECRITDIIRRRCWPISPT